MADTKVAEEVINATANGTAPSGRAAATPEGLLLAYSALIGMALLPIWYGSFRSVVYNIKQKESGKKIESMTKKDAAMFPIIASCALFGLFLCFMVFGKDMVNTLLTAYFFVIGTFCVAELIKPIIQMVLPGSFPNATYDIVLTRNVDADTKEVEFEYNFDRVYVVCIICSAGVGVWYLLKKHWIANNIFGLAFSLTGVEMLHLNSFPIGCILLGGLFVYDIFWVFGTNVMVTVATKFDAPIKLIFPMDFLENGLWGKNFAMLGLGDIVIPGIFIALLLRYDVSKGNDSRAYFYACYVAYFLGLMTTVGVLHVFKSAQPALLYLVPACIGSALLIALVKGEIPELLKYEDHPEEMLLSSEKSNTEKKEE